MESYDKDTNAYLAAVRQFYDTYRPIARKYSLKIQIRTSISGGNWIKIFKGEGRYREQIARVKEDDDTHLYNRATEAIASWARSEEEMTKAAV